MAKRPRKTPTRTPPLSFKEFDRKLKAGVLSPAEHRRYLEVDPRADQVRVRFKPGALRDAPPPGYDIDRELHYAVRARQERALAAMPLAAMTRVVAEGDSWFNLPPFIRPQAIADRISSNGRVAMKNIAKWGDTLEEMLHKREYLRHIETFAPEYFIVSGGGNDLQELLKHGGLVYEYFPERPIDKCLTPAADQLLYEIAQGYRTLLNEVAVLDPKLTTICYAYDYPRPTYKSGKYIGQYLKEAGYPVSTWNDITILMIDRLTKAIQPVTKAFPNARFIDCRGETAGYPFFDDMHPHEEGFRILADRFERALRVPQAARSRKTRSTTNARRRSQRRRGTRKRSQSKRA